MAKKPFTADLVVISRDDFRACADSEKFLALVDERLDALRFDM